MYLPTKLWVLAALTWDWDCICVPHRCSRHSHSGSGESSSKPDPQPFFPPSWYWDRCRRVFWILSLIQLWHKLSFTLAVAFRINTSECWHHYCLVGFLLKNSAIPPPPPLHSAPKQERIKSGELYQYKILFKTSFAKEKNQMPGNTLLCFYCYCCCSERMLVVGTIFCYLLRSESLNYTETHKELQPESRMSKHWRITVSPS